MTVHLLAWASQRREQLKEDWANGSFAGVFETEMLVRNAGATGAASALKDLIDIQHEDLMEQDNGK